ncbi:UNVERIFIED_CONTAM: hypothetical protein GTU68_032636 [Idotea baltica]|nr:hypothetical protein [Idotea baltica]
MIINDVTGGVVTHPGVALTFGAIVTVVIYSFGKISGAHINPAVTLGFAMTKEINKRDVLPYVIFQIIGAFLASATLWAMFSSHETLGATLPVGSVMRSFALELILTYFLMIVILFVGQNEEVKSFTGLAVGATVMLECMFAGPICNASMNPARSLAPAIMSGHLEHLWLYIAAPLLGAILATLTWIFMAKSID